MTISSFGQIMMRNGTATNKGACPITLGCDVTWYSFEHIDYFCQLLVKNLICSVAEGGGRRKTLQHTRGMCFSSFPELFGGTALLSQYGWLFQLRSSSQWNCSFILPWPCIVAATSRGWLAVRCWVWMLWWSRLRVHLGAEPGQPSLPSFEAELFQWNISLWKKWQILIKTRFIRVFPIRSVYCTAL